MISGVGDGTSVSKFSEGGAAVAGGLASSGLTHWSSGVAADVSHSTEWGVAGDNGASIWNWTGSSVSCCCVVGGNTSWFVSFPH